MLKIRLMRIGAKQRPFYRVVVVDERAKRTGAYIELLGTYNPLTEPKEIKLKQDRIDYWIKQGAQLSTGFLRIIGKAPQRLPRKPKKEKKEVKPEEKVAEATKSSEPEVTGVVESTPSEGTSGESNSQQTGSEAPSETSLSETSEPSGTSATDESTPEKEQEQANTEPTIEESEKKDERPA